MGHIEDRWFRPKRDELGRLTLNDKGNPVLERTELYGRGLRYRVRYQTPDGDERSKSFPDRKKKLAEDFLTDIESDKLQGKYVDPRAAGKTFRQQAENWLKGQSSDPATRATLKSRLESRIYPKFGNLKLADIGPSAVRDWLGGLDERGYSENYKSVLFGVLSGVLDSAVDDRFIRENPCSAKSVRRPVAGSPRVQAWPESRMREVREGLERRFSIVVPLGCGLGLRQGEILGFSPDDLDREKMEIAVQRQVKLVEGVLMFALPKRGKTRVVPASKGIVAEIDAYEKEFGSAQVTLPFGRADGELVTVRLLVTGEAGKPYSGDLFSKVVWQKAFRRSGIDFRRRADGMHALRHFYASVLLSRGVSIKELAEYLGHADAGFTLRTYTHMMTDSHERARMAVDDVFGRPESPDGLEAA